MRSKKKSISSIFTILCMVAMTMVLGACSDDKQDAPDDTAFEGAVDNAFMQKLLSTLNGTYSLFLSKMRLYEFNGNDWETVSVSGQSDWDILPPSSFEITDGVALVNLVYWCPTLTSELFEIWRICYRQTMGMSDYVCVASPLEYLPETGQLKSGQWISEIKKATGRSLNLVCYNADGDKKIEVEYSCSEVSLRERLFRYDSLVDAHLAMIAMMRQLYGDRLDLNELLGEGYLGNPIMDFDELETAVRDGSFFES